MITSIIKYILILPLILSTIYSMEHVDDSSDFKEKQDSLRLFVVSPQRSLRPLNFALSETTIVLPLAHPKLLWNMVYTYHDLDKMTCLQTKEFVNNPFNLSYFQERNSSSYIIALYSQQEGLFGHIQFGHSKNGSAIIIDIISTTEKAKPMGVLSEALEALTRNGEKWAIRVYRAHTHTIKALLLAGFTLTSPRSSLFLTYERQQ